MVTGVVTKASLDTLDSHMTCKDTNRVVTCDDIIGKYDKIRRRSEMLHHKDNPRAMYWTIMILNP